MGSDKAIPKNTHLGGFGVVAIVRGPRGSGDGKIALALPLGDQSVVEFDMSATEEGGAAAAFQVLTFYALITRLERDGYTDIINSVGHVTCQRQISHGRDTLTVTCLLYTSPSPRD